MFSMDLGERTTFCLSCMFCLTTPLFIVPIERKIPPSFTKKPSGTIEDTEGKMVKIEGRVAGSQPLTVNWYKDGMEIFTSDFYDVTFKSSLAVLCIKKSQLSDSGTYMCKISNEAGTASYDVSVKITGIQLVSMSNFSYFNFLVISVLLLEKKSTVAVLWYSDSIRCFIVLNFTIMGNTLEYHVITIVVS